MIGCSENLHTLSPPWHMIGHHWSKPCLPKHLVPLSGRNTDNHEGELLFILCAMCKPPFTYFGSLPSHQDQCSLVLCDEPPFPCLKVASIGGKEAPLYCIDYEIVSKIVYFIIIYRTKKSEATIRFVV